MDDENPIGRKLSDDKEYDSIPLDDGTLKTVLKQPERIITVTNGHLNLDTANLTKITLDLIKDDHPVAFVSVIGPPQSGKSFMTNLIIYRGSNLEGGGWLETLVKGGKFLEGFHYGAVASSDKIFASPEGSGVYLWPTPFLMTKATGEKVYIWVLHYHIPDRTSDSRIADLDAIENVLGLMCSRLLEIITGKGELRIATIRRNFLPSQNVCDSLLVLYLSEDTNSSSKVLTEYDAKKLILNLGMDTKMYESTLDEFKSLNLMRIKRTLEPLHDEDGRFIQEAFKALIIPLKTTVNYFLLEEDEIIPKKILEEELITVSKMEIFLEDCINRANDYNSKKVAMSRSLILNKDNLTTEQHKGEENEENVSEKANEYGDTQNCNGLRSEISFIPIGPEISCEGSENGDENVKVAPATEFTLATDPERTNVKQISEHVRYPEDSGHCLNCGSKLHMKMSENHEKVALMKGKLSQEQLNLEMNNRESTDGDPEIETGDVTEIDIDANKSPLRNLSKPRISMDEIGNNQDDIPTSYESNEKNKSESPTDESETQLMPFSLETDQTSYGISAHALYTTPSASESFSAETSVVERKLSVERMEKADGKVQQGLTIAKSPKEAEEDKPMCLDEMKHLDLEWRQRETWRRTVHEAVADVKKAVLKSAYSWVNVNAKNPQQIPEFLIILNECFNRILICKYSNAISPYLWEDFCRSVHFECSSDCTTFLKAAFDPVCKVGQELEEQFRLNGYFSHKTFQNMTAQIQSNFAALEAQMDPHSYALMTSAMGDLLNIYKSTTSAIAESEQVIRDEMGQRVKDFYNHEMKRYLAGNNLYTRNELYQVHCLLSKELLKSCRNIANPSSASLLPEEDAEDWISNLELELKEAFSTFKGTNQFKLVSLRKQVDKIISERYNEYVIKMEDFLQRRPEGYDTEKLAAIHNTFSKEQEDLLCTDLRSSIRESEPTQGHWESLSFQINKYWSKIAKANEENLKSAREQRSLKRESTQNIASTATKSNSFTKPRESKPRPSPLIFRLSYSHAAMGAVVDGKFQLLCNSHGETSTPLAITFNKHGELLYGSDAMMQHHFWWITDYLGKTNQFVQKKVQIQQSVNRRDYEITVEFLLGYLMRSLRSHAAHQIRRNFKDVIITIPYWFCSTHRIQVKDAAKIAGFNEVNLVSEESAAAYAFFENNPSGTLLVISENFGIVSGILYSKSKSDSEAIAMISQNFAYSQVDKQKGFGQWLKHPMQSFKDSVSTHVTKLSKESKINLAREICDHVLKSCRIYKGDELWPNNTIILTDSENVENGNLDWMEAFKYVVTDKGYGRVVGIEDVVTGSGLVVLLGASVFCQMPLKNIGERIRDAFVHPILMSSLRAIECAIHVDSVRFLPEKSKVIQHELPEMVRSARYFQQSPFDNTEEVLVGILELGPTIPSARKVYPMFEINSEGIVILKEVRCDAVQTRQKSTNEYYWTTPNLKECQRNDINGFVESLAVAAMEFDGEVLHETSPVMTVKARPIERSDLIEAKAQLRRAIQDVEQGFLNDSYNFKTKIHAELLETKLEIAKDIMASTKSEVTVEDIRIGTDELLEKYNKYKKL